MTRSRRTLATLLVGILAVGIGQVPTAPSRADVKNLPSPQDVTGVKLTPVTVDPRPEWTAGDRELTEDDLPPDPEEPTDPEQPTDPIGSQVVDLGVPSPTAQTTSRRVRAGTMPVYLAAAPVAARSLASPVRKVRIDLVDRRSTTAAGITGMVVKLARADGATQPGQAVLSVDYRSIENRFGGDARSRLRLVQVADGRPVPSVNDVKTRTLTATVPLAAGGVARSFAVAAAPQGENGDYKSSTLTPASTWQVSQQTGSFSWAYPIKAPAPPGGVAPELALSYSSGSIDGRTSGNNTQGSWIGDGWDMWPGYIERSYRSCADDRDPKEKPDPNNVEMPGDDLCYFNDNATMSFNGSATELVKVAGSENKDDGTRTIRYRGVSDDGSRIEQISDGRHNGDDDGTHWRVTTVDGTQYYFGRDTGEGGSSAGAKTNSVFAVPVYSNHADEAGYDKEFAKSRVTRAWRWNLDYTVDPNGNTITYFYNTEAGAYAREGDKDKRTTYDRGGYLTRVEYGTRRDAPSSVRPADRVLFDSVDRCIGKCLTSKGKPIASRFPDTPWEQYCDKAPCTTQFSPTFWTQKRLSTIRAQVYAGSGDTYTDVDSWSLSQSYLQAGDNESTPMWFKSITHTAQVTSAGGAPVKYPEVVFDPNADIMPNRVDTPNGHPSLFRSRLGTVTTESGAQIGVTYSKPECDGKPLPQQWSNTKRCFPQFYGAEGETPKLDWFNKYVVTRVDVYDNTGGFNHQQTNYDYLDSPAWAYDDSELTKPKKRTWGQFRGYGHVAVRQGVESGVQSKTEYRYFRGMDGDKQPKKDELPPVGTPRDIQVVDSAGGKVDDHPAFAGMVREEITYNGGDWVDGTLNTPVHDGPTASAGSLRSWMVHVEKARTRTRLSTGATRWTTKITKVNDDNLTTSVTDLGDEADSTDDRCALTEYARNEATWMLDRVKQSKKLGVGCTTDAPRPQDVLSDVRTYYDTASTFGGKPTRGLPVLVEQLDHFDGTTPVYTELNRTGYDAAGRITSQTDALGRTTTTDYVPDAGPVIQTIVTNPLGQRTTTTLNPALGVPVKATDINGGLTEATYDGAGRLLAMWAPGRDRKTYPSDPSVSYAYQVRKNASSTVTTKNLMPSGSKNYRTVVILYDGLLRERQTQTQTIAGGRAVTDTVYDSRGLTDWVSSPYYDIDNTAPDTTLVTARGRPEIPALTQNVYDGAGRLTDALFMVNGDEKWRTRTVYAGEKTTVVPPQGGTATTSVSDLRGRQTELRQYKDPAKAGGDDATSFDRTTYAYTGRDELASVVGPGGNVWRYAYDLRGHKTATQDPDNGSSTSGYDAVGQLAWTRDARGKVLAYTYDKLGRRTAMRQSSASGPVLAEWEYDTLPHGIGKLTRATRYEYPDGGPAAAYTNAVTAYDTAGRPTSTSLTIPASEAGLCAAGGTNPCTFTQTMNYRPNGAPDQTRLPAVGGLPAETVTTLYNPLGLANGLLGKQIYAQDIVYNQLDQLIGQNLGEHGSRVGIAYTYDQPTGRLTSFLAAPELKDDIYHLAYTYSNAGDITAISDTPDVNQPAETQCFRYDHLRRLTDAWTPAARACGTAPGAGALGGPAPYWQSYAYDASGNRKTEVLHATTDTTRTYAYPAPGGAAGTRPHAVTGVATTGGSTVTQQYAYDASGNTVCRPAGAASNACGTGTGTGTGTESQTLAWNDEGRLAKSVDKSGETSFVYDADGNRLIRRDPTGATLYLPDGTEVRKPKTGNATGTRYYSHAGSTIAVRTPAGVSWIIGDHHGTGSATVSGDKNLTVTRRRTLPFGDVRGVKPALWAGDKGFVGGTQDNTGLTHLGAREYDPALGRFVSVDPVMDLADPQQWSAYNYADDSPLSRSDASGMLSLCGMYAGECDDTPETPGGGHHNSGGGTTSGGGTSSGGGSGSRGGSGSNSGGTNGGGGTRNGNGAANSTVQATASGTKNKCGHFSWACDGWQWTMELIHENQEPLANIAVDLMEIEAGTSLMTGGASIFAGGVILDSSGVGTVIGVPANAAGAGLVVAGSGLTSHGAWELGKDVRNLHMKNEASGSTSGASDAPEPPKISRQQQAGHIKGTPQYTQRMKVQKPTSTWLEGEDADALTLEAWERGTPVPNNPHLRIYEVGRPVGEGGYGGTQTQVRVSMNGKGEIHGSPWGPVTR